MGEKTRSERKQMNRTTATTHLASPVKAKPKTVWDLSRCEEGIFFFFEREIG
jgi:hypothetical protein